MPSPVKVAALGLGLRVAQPTSSADLFDCISSVPGLELAVVVAYGRIIRPDSLAIPLAGMLNVHFSLLPRWRGAAPVHRALIAGDPMTGVTIIRLDDGLDTGPVLTAQAVDIDADETVGSLTDRLAVIGADLLVSSLAGYLSGAITPVPQSDEGLTYADKIGSKDRKIDLSMTPIAVVNLVRGLAPQPGAVIGIDGEPHKILQATVSSESVAEGVWEAFNDRPVLGLAAGSVEVHQIQPPGRNVMDASDWVRGRSAAAGRIR
jgi:methionyl-tRNA formyltransferase